MNYRIERHGNTEVRRGGHVVGVYLTMLLEGRAPDAPLRSLGDSRG